MLLKKVRKFLPDYTALIPEDCNFLVSNILYSRRPFFKSRNNKKKHF
jgi:hypothetical protein